MPMHQFRILRFLLVAGALTVLGGCHSFLGYRGWPFPERDHTTFHTPAMRIDTVKQFARQTDGTDSPSQRALTDQLARQIQIEPDPLVREAIIRAAADFHTPLAIQIVEAGLGDSSRVVRVACCQALGQRAEPRCVPSLAKTLRDDEEMDVRLAAAEALGKINSPESMAALVPALDDRDPAMQYVGVQSMKSITGKDYGGDVAVWRQVATGGTPPTRETPSVAERIRDFSPF
jgi:hypothetical protein